MCIYPCSKRKTLSAPLLGTYCLFQNKVQRDSKPISHSGWASVGTWASCTLDVRGNQPLFQFQRTGWNKGDNIKRQANAWRKSLVAGKFNPLNSNTPTTSVQLKSWEFWSPSIRKSVWVDFFYLWIAKRPCLFMTGREWVGAASTLHLWNQVPRRGIEFFHHGLLAYQGHCVHLPWILSSGAFVSRLGRVQAGVRPSCSPWQNSWAWCWFISLYGVSLWYSPWRMIRHSSHRLSSELGTDESYLPICTNKISKSTWLGSPRCHMTWDLHRSSLLSLIQIYDFTFNQKCLFTILWLSFTFYISFYNWSICRPWLGAPPRLWLTWPWLPVTFVCLILKCIHTK